jgi:hypothetical protein
VHPKFYDKAEQVADAAQFSSTPQKTGKASALKYKPDGYHRLGNVYPMSCRDCAAGNRHSTHLIERLSMEEIIKRPEAQGAEILHQRISEGLQNPFCVGRLSQSLWEGEMVDGKQEKRVSKAILKGEC